MSEPEIGGNGGGLVQLKQGRRSCHIRVSLANFLSENFMCAKVLVTPPPIAPTLE